ncbi:hypothetical protein VKT23_014907 [Stygiomarasmius scandens]|uniref:Uncharacterized protein n=1 Tax=Marasmiellus scandens TaxID=2682957 RepID=A0ABR1J0U9_9AGAR
MHTKSLAGINADIITEKDSDAAPTITPSEEESMHWKAPFATEDAENERLMKISRILSKIWQKMSPLKNNILDGKLYSFKELEKVDRGIAPVDYEEEINVLQNSKGGKWSVKDLMQAAGV